VPGMGRAMGARYRNQNAAFCDPSEGDVAEVIRMPLNRMEWLADRPARRGFDWLVANADLVHVHGLWSHHAVAARHAALRHRKPYLVSAHGMLEPWALRNKAWKKRAYGALVERRNLAGARCLRALTRDEVADYRRYGVKLPIAVVPNGIDPAPEVSAEAFWAAFPELRGRRLALFLGRVHFKKGLDVLCRAWAGARRGADARLVIAGPDSEGTRARLEALIAELGIAREVTFTGLLDSELKWSALAAAQVFVLPSYSEGQSMAVLEALAAGVPVIASANCHVPEIAEQGCGWVVEPEPAAVSAALGEGLEATDAERAEMGSHGRRLIERRFRWPVVAAQMAAVYDWVLGGGRPGDVEVFE